ncbi:MAG: translocated intimin receptor Tir [Acidobacteria bacterium]|nr:translocated intimin receptor Tir [Acidobacteriota bacterium]
MKPSTLRSILTDLHFWVPVIVLVLGTGLLAVMR